MEQNPYESPAHQPQDSSVPCTETKRPRVVRKGIPLAFVVAWNGPLLVVLYYGFTGVLSERTMNLLMASWASLIPIGSLLVAYLPALQRWIFVPDFAIATIRPKLWAVSILWTLIVGLWVGFELYRP